MEASEKVLWSDKPAKKAFILPALGGIPFGLIFLSIFLLWLVGLPIMHDPSNPLPIELAYMAAGWGLGLIIVPPLWQVMKYPNTEYLITDQRLIIQTWAFKQKVWWAYFREIKEIGVRKGLVDKWLGTGTVYLITPSHPFAPGMRFTYTEGSPFRVHKLHNPATGDYEEFTEMEIWRKTSWRPCLQALSEPFEVQKLLQREIDNVQRTESQTVTPRLNSDQLSTDVQFQQLDSSQKKGGMKQKIALSLGTLLLLSGFSVYAYVYFTRYIPWPVSNEYTYIDYFALFGFAFGWIGVVILFFVLLRQFIEWARKHGAIVRDF